MYQEMQNRFKKSENEANLLHSDLEDEKEKVKQLQAKAEKENKTAEELKQKIEELNKQLLEKAKDSKSIMGRQKKVLFAETLPTLLFWCLLTLFFFNELYSLFLKFSALGLLQDIRNNFHSEVASMMTSMVYVYCPLTVVTSHHFLPGCTQIGVTLNDVTSFPAKIAYKAISSTLQKYLRAYEQLAHEWKK